MPGRLGWNIKTLPVVCVQFYSWSLDISCCFIVHSWAKCLGIRPTHTFIYIYYVQLQCAATIYSDVSLVPLHDSGSGYVLPVPVWLNEQIPTSTLQYAVEPSQMIEGYHNCTGGLNLEWDVEKAHMSIMVTNFWLYNTCSPLSCWIVHNIFRYLNLKFRHQHAIILPTKTLDLYFLKRELMISCWGPREVTAVQTLWVFVASGFSVEMSSY